jgi:hypothetical protein
VLVAVWLDLFVGGGLDGGGLDGGGLDGGGLEDGGCELGGGFCVCDGGGGGGFCFFGVVVAGVVGGFLDVVVVVVVDESVVVVVDESVVGASELVLSEVGAGATEVCWAITGAAGWCAGVVSAVLLEERVASEPSAVASTTPDTASKIGVLRDFAGCPGSGGGASCSRPVVSSINYLSAVGPGQRPKSCVQYQPSVSRPTPMVV